MDAYMLNLDVRECCRNIISRGKSDVIGFALHAQEMHTYATQILEAIDPENMLTVIAGGVYATRMFQELLTTDVRFDYVIRGEGERTLELLLSQLRDPVRPASPLQGIAQRNSAGEVICGKQRLLESDLDNFGIFPFSWWEEQRNAGSASLVTSRGCSGACGYCIVGPHWGTKNCWRGHSAPWVFARIEELVEQLGIDYIHFVDDEFIGNELSIRRVNELVELLKRSSLKIRFQFMCRADTVARNRELFSRLRAVGLSHVFVGIESGNDCFLQTWRKGFQRTHAETAVGILDALGVTCCSGTIIFHPLTTPESILVDVDFFERLLDGYAMFEVNGLYEMDILKGTPIAQKFKDFQQKMVYGLNIANPAADEICRLWRIVQQRWLIPVLEILGFERFKVLKRGFARWQLQALRRIVVAVNSGVSRKLVLQQVQAHFLQFCRRTLGPEVFLGLLTKSFHSNEQSKVVQEQERCFVGEKS
jgi:hypothetical protein